MKNMEDNVSKRTLNTLFSKKNSYRELKKVKKRKRYFCIHHHIVLCVIHSMEFLRKYRSLSICQPFKSLFERYFFSVLRCLIFFFVVSFYFSLIKSTVTRDTFISTIFKRDYFWMTFVVFLNCLKFHKSRLFKTSSVRRPLEDRVFPKEKRKMTGPWPAET